MEIVATIRCNPNEKSFYSNIERLWNLGVKKLRFNYSKVTSFEEKSLLYREINEIQKRWYDIKILVDIPFPGKKTRLFSNATKTLEIQRGAYYNFIIIDEEVNSQSKINSFYLTNLNVHEIHVGMKAIYNSGEGAFIITKKDNNEIVLKALNNFTVFDSKSLSFGNIRKLSYDSVVREICSNTKVDGIAFSFVESEEDLFEAQTLGDKYGFNIISKIETIKGIRNLRNILQMCDQIILGRGDLGVDSLQFPLFNYEEYVANICNTEKKFLYFATGFMNSCISNYLPSSSDIIDLSYAISLHPSSLIFNVDLVASEGFENSVRYIQEIEKMLSKGRNK